LKSRLEKYQCNHYPKVAKKIGSIDGCSVEISVCSNCRMDPDLADFNEVLEK